jgi:hypothetical protein
MFEEISRWWNNVFVVVVEAEVAGLAALAYKRTQ